MTSHVLPAIRKLPALSMQTQIQCVGNFVGSLKCYENCEIVRKHENCSVRRALEMRWRFIEKKNWISCWNCKNNYPACLEVGTWIDSRFGKFFVYRCMSDFDRKIRFSASQTLLTLIISKFDAQHYVPTSYLNSMWILMPWQFYVGMATVWSVFAIDIEIFRTLSISSSHNCFRRKNS